LARPAFEGVIRRTLNRSRRRWSALSGVEEDAADAGVTGDLEMLSGLIDG
jgi:hypothetical protein